MKKFLEMIEIAKRNGIVGANSNGEFGKYTKIGLFWGFVEKCHPFVFLPKNEDPEELPEKLTPQGSDIRSLDVPFQVFSIEVLGQYISIPRPEDETQVFIDCIMVAELAPREFLYHSLVEVRQDGQSRRIVFAGNSEGPIVEAFVKRLNREAIGVEHIRERVKIGTGSEKRVATFRKIVHVRPKKMLELAGDRQSRNIDWTHRWAVRGHWREVAGLGKDRDGNYCMEGMTWVSEYEKGPEDAPLVKKTRLVTS